MIRPAARWTLTAAALLVIGFGALLLNRAPAAAPVRNDSADAAGFTAWRGVNSCTAAACHGDTPARGLHGSEYAVWVGKDPHARAYQVLFDPRSESIQKNLNAFAAPKDHTCASRNLLCLGCHVAPEAETAVEAAPVWFGDGVGCESCHGAAAGWLAAHVGAGWQQMSAEDKAAHGFRNTKDLTVRAKTCTDCHVGGGRADVNHDLYAAGHPPLQYEYSSFLARYRPYQHWSEADDRRRDPAYEADAWAVGQVVTTRAALRLLAVRADARHPWPEFAEYDCSSCHHDIGRQGFASVSRDRPGSPRWSWFVSLAPLLPQPPPAERVRQLRDLMERRDPDPVPVVAGAAALADFYDRTLNHAVVNRSMDAAALRARLDALTGPAGQEIARGDWEDARQLGFAVAAHERSLAAVAPDPARAAAVGGLEERLRPADYDPAAAVKALQNIHHMLDHRP